MSDKTTYPKEFLAYIQSITNKRAKIVIDHILQHGFITTEDLENTYGYNHPPRAARDVREAGIPLETFKVKSSDGKSIAAYKFENIDNLQINRIRGRVSFPKVFKRDLYELSKGKCAVCNGNFEERYLQIDHKTPYQVGGDLSNNRSLDEFMLLCGSCNSAKSRSCEHCDNWELGKKVDICKQCYWGNPITYSHIAMKDIRRIELQWEGKEVNYYDKMQKNAEMERTELHEFVKQIIKEKLKG